MPASGRRWRGAAGFVFLLLAAASCQPAPPEVAPASPTLTPRPVPPTATPEPTARPEATPTPLPSPSPTPEDPLRAAPTREDEALAALLRSQDLRPRDYLALAEAIKGVRAKLLPPDSCKPRAYQIGDRETFWILESDTQTNAQVEAVLSHVSERAYLWTQVGLLERTEQLRQAGEEFDRLVYPNDRRLFGEEHVPGVDCDPRVHILHAGGLGRVTGSYKSVDQYPSTIVRTSNQREMFYMSVEHAEVGEELYLATLAHEFQHMIHWWHDSNEDLWLNEGLAELAIFKSDLYGAEYGADEYLRRPSTGLTSWPARSVGPAGDFPHYGAGFLFTLYLSEQFGDDFILQLVRHPASGIRSLDELLEPFGETFDTVFAQWIVANYLDDLSLADGRFGYYELNPALPKVKAEVSDYPATVRGDLPQYGADYLLLESERDLELLFQGQSRVPVLPVEPHSGRYAWWSNRGDSSDTTLTRAFDLSGLETAHLIFWTWYSLESDLDFVHLEVSTDGGRTWKVIKASNMVDPDPLALAMGWGYTGTNAPVGAREWTRQVANLSDYAGQEILVRFQMLTDAGIHLPGFFLDDIEIPELGYFDDVEGGEGGWEADGFARSHNYLPQGWLVRLVTLDGPPEVHELVVDGTGRGRWQVEGFGRGFERVMLVIAPAAPKTTLEATYSLTIEARR